MIFYYKFTRKINIFIIIYIYDNAKEALSLHIIVLRDTSFTEILDLRPITNTWS